MVKVHIGVIRWHEDAEAFQIQCKSILIIAGFCSNKHDDLLRSFALSPRESPLEVLDPEHETHLLAKGNPEGGPEDPLNAPVVAAILRNPNRKQNAESPSLDRAARTPDLAHLRLKILVFTDCSLIGEGEFERR